MATANLNDDRGFGESMPCGATFNVRILSPIRNGLSRSKRTVKVVEIIDLNTARFSTLIVEIVLKNALLNSYPESSYVGKDFSIAKLEPALGKNYSLFNIQEVIIADESSRCAVDSLCRLHARSIKEAKSRKTARSYSISEQEYKQLVGIEWDEWYGRYLKRKLWKHVIKPRVMDRDNGLCVRCGGKAIAVHHRSYAFEVMQGNDDDSLASVCEGCHNLIHYDDLGMRRVKEECDQILLATDAREDFPPPLIDLRRRSYPYPSTWHRMTARQREAFSSEADRLIAAKRAKKALSLRQERASDGIRRKIR